MLQVINVTISICCLVFLTIISCFYFFKEKLNNVDNKIFSTIIIINIIGVIIDIFGYFTFHKFGIENILNIVIAKIYLIYFVSYAFCLMIYIWNLTFRTTRNLEKAIIIFIFLCIITYCLPIHIYMNDGVTYTHGISVSFSYAIGMIIICIMLFCLLKNIKKINKRKFIPLFAFVILTIITVIIQIIYPQITLLLFTDSIVTTLMYFTIENPDVRMIEQLQISKNHAEKANRAKSDFLSSMSHEIRTPLNAIVGLSEDNLTYIEQIPNEVAENSKDIINASQTLLEIVGNILDINKIESSKMEIVKKPYNLKEEITNLCSVTTTKIGNKPIEFKLVIAEDVPYELIGDKIHVKQIINNLLSNAIKYTEEGTITLNIKCVNDISKSISNIVISCEDTGRGIKPELISKLFNKFERLDIEKNTTTEGTGLGLAITKSLVDMMGGKINVNSQFGQGSIFVVTIPQRISKLIEPIQNIEDQYYALNKTTTKDYGHKKILVVDDNELNIKVVRRLLTGFDFEIVECRSGLECLNKITEGNEFDLVLMDIMMPDMNGSKVLAKLKENLNFNIPVIAVTADALSGAKEKYISEGFIDYMSKPFSKEQIKQKIDKIFNVKI